MFEQNATTDTGGADTTPPIVTIQSPLNITYPTSNIWFNVTLNENGNTCLVNYGTGNKTMTNSTGNWNLQNSTMATGTYTALFYCNDTAGNMNVTSRTFGIDVSAPVLTITRPLDILYPQTSGWFEFNWSSSETPVWAGYMLEAVDGGSVGEAGEYLNSTLYSQYDTVNLTVAENEYFNWPFANQSFPEAFQQHLNASGNADWNHVYCYDELYGWRSYLKGRPVNSLLEVYTGESCAITDTYSNGGITFWNSYFNVSMDGNFTWSRPTLSILDLFKMVNDIENINIMFCWRNDWYSYSPHYPEYSTLSDIQYGDSCSIVMARKGGNFSVRDYNVSAFRNESFWNLTAGTYKLTLNANDSAGNMGSATTTFTIVSAPIITVQSPANTTYNYETITDFWFNITATGDVVNCTVDGNLMANSSGNWNYQNTSMDQGVHTAAFECTDTYGGVGTKSVTFTILPPGPSIIINLPLASPVYSDAFSFAYGNTTCSKYAVDDGLNVTNCTLTDDSWNGTFTGLSDGPHHVVVWANNSAGDAVEAIRYWTRDMTPITPPVITINQPLNDTINSDIFSFTFDKEIYNAKYSLDGAANETNSTLTTFWTGTFAGLVDNPHCVVVWANDTYGNQAEAERCWTFLSNWSVVLYSENDWETPFNVSKTNSTQLFVYCTDKTTRVYNFTSYQISGVSPSCTIETMLVLVNYGSDSYTREVAPVGSSGSVRVYLSDAYTNTILQIPFVMSDYRYYNAKLTLYKSNQTNTFTIAEGYFDVNHQYNSYLIKDNKYFIRLTTSAETREIGYVSTVSATTQYISLATINLQPDISLFSSAITIGAELDNATGTMRLQYNDSTGGTTGVNFRIYYETNTTPIYTGEFNASNYLLTLPGLNTSHRYHAEFDIHHSIFYMSPVHFLIAVGSAAVDWISTVLPMWIFPAVGLVFLFFTGVAITPKRKLQGLIIMIAECGAIASVGWLQTNYMSIGVSVVALILLSLETVSEIRRKAGEL